MDIKDARRLGRKVYEQRADEAIQQRVRLFLLSKRGKIAMPLKESSGAFALTESHRPANL